MFFLVGGGQRKFLRPMSSQFSKLLKKLTPFTIHNYLIRSLYLTILNPE